MRTFQDIEEIITIQEFFGILMDDRATLRVSWHLEDALGYNSPEAILNAAIKVDGFTHVEPLDILSWKVDGSHSEGDIISIEFDLDIEETLDQMMESKPLNPLQLTEPITLSEYAARQIEVFFGEVLSLRSDPFLRRLFEALAKELWKEEMAEFDDSDKFIV
jgi:hypothetical protein